MKRILCFGDSNTWGLIPGTNERYEWGKRWTSILQERSADKKFQVIEEGLCGRTTVYEDRNRIGRAGSPILPILLESHNPIDLVILMLGTNDCKSEYLTTPEAIGTGIEHLLKQIRKADKQCKVLLISPIALGEQVWKEQYDPEFSKESVECSKRLKAIYREISEKWQIDFLAASDYAYASEADMEHMDESGHMHLADAVYNRVVNILG